MNNDWSSFGKNVQSKEKDDATFFVLVKGGTFVMGSSPEKPKASSPDQPPCKVTLSSFYIGRYQVTQKEYERLMLQNPSHFKGAMLPVEQVNWYNAVEYCNRLSKAEGLPPAYTIETAKKDPNNRNYSDDLRWTVTWNRKSEGYRLPTEAEWEYAAKGGAGASRNFLYAGSNDPDNVSWYGANSKGTTHPVGSKIPNALGLYDMSGNVWEWCWDWFGHSPAESQTNPAGAALGSDRVYRGGGWAFSTKHLRCVDRYGAPPKQSGNYLGFRIVRSALES
ncbi:MAG: formylglycine-generating enzyme family protein [Spirochaetaceae bacterium]|jgi:formylglycine-generating enzyme required for sulfatase activity|nr:formylglycine-generating enzyme family protein [Spirochaetaceae bacterium]